MKHQLIGIVPVFDFSDTVRLVKIYEIRNNDQKQIVRIIKPKKLIKSKIYYSFFPILYKKNESMRLAKYYSQRLVEKITSCFH